MELVSRGDVKAFHELIRRHQQAVLNLAFRFLGDSEEAKDITQETFLRVFQSAERYTPEAQFRVFLFRIVTNLCVENVRKKRPIYMEKLPEGESVPSPLDELQKEERQKAVLGAIQSLPENQRIALLLQHFEGLKYAEIAEVMGTTVPAVESLLVRGKRTLRQELAKYL